MAARLAARLTLSALAATSALSASPSPSPAPVLRVAVGTWWPGSVAAARALLAGNFSALDAAQAGAVAAEESFAFGDHTVGPDGSPDSTGETTLDALLCDGATGDVGAVAYLRRTPSAIRAARAVMDFTQHSLLAGAGASALAQALGGQPDTNLSGPFDAAADAAWRAADCQPNFYAADNVLGANASCGPYAPRPLPAPTPLPPALHGAGGAAALAAARRAARPQRWRGFATEQNHDTLGLCALDAAGSLAAAVTSNGARHKIAGRVGDAPVVGAGGYASDAARGCAAATGDGDITQRFLPAFVAVENMARGMPPQAACEDAVRRIMARVANFSIGIVCLDAAGAYGAAAHGWEGSAFSFCAAAPGAGAAPVCARVPSLE